MSLQVLFLICIFFFLFFKVETQLFAYLNTYYVFVLIFPSLLCILDSIILLHVICKFLMKKYNIGLG